MIARGKKISPLDGTTMHDVCARKVETHSSARHRQVPTVADSVARRRDERIRDPYQRPTTSRQTLRGPLLKRLSKKLRRMRPLNKSSLSLLASRRPPASGESPSAPSMRADIGSRPRVRDKTWTRKPGRTDGRTDGRWTAREELHLAANYARLGYIRLALVGPAPVRVHREACTANVRSYKNYSDFRPIHGILRLNIPKVGWCSRHHCILACLYNTRVRTRVYAALHTHAPIYPGTED